MPKLLRPLGPSDVASLLGFVPGRSALDVYREVTIGPKIREAPRNELEIVLRVALLTEYARRAARAVVATGAKADPKLPDLVVTPDAVAVDDKGRVLCGVTTACVPWRDAVAYGMVLPRRVQLEAQASMAALGVPVWDVAALLSGPDHRFEIYRVPRDDRVIEVVRSVVASFLGLVESGTPPAAEFGADLIRLACDLYPRPTETRWKQDDSSATRQSIEMYADAADGLKEAQADYEFAAGRVMLAIGDHTGIRCEVGAATWDWRSKKGKRELVVKYWGAKKVEPKDGEDDEGFDETIPAQNAGRVTENYVEREIIQGELHALVVEHPRRVEIENMIEAECEYWHVNSMTSIPDEGFFRLADMIRREVATA